jgi:hypothetical protein
LEFEVIIQGLDDKNLPMVKFVLTNEAQGCDCAYRCVRAEGKHMWVAKLPPLTHIKGTDVPFHVEVVVDGYYFEPAQGTVSFIVDPSVKFATSSGPKPTVTTSFKVKQEEDKPAKKEKKVDKKEEKVVVKEDGPDSMGYAPPSNAHLTPEFEPETVHTSSAKTPGTEADDEQIDHSRLDDIASSVTPGETTDPEPQQGRVLPNDTDTEEEEFDPRQIAQTIVKNTFGSIQKPEKKGALFKRDASGKAVISGIDTPEEKAMKAAKAAKVRDILGR